MMPMFPPTHRRVLQALLLAATVALTALAEARPALADDVLENSPVLRRALLYRASRHEIGGFFNATLGDPFTRNLLPGVRYDFHLLEWLSIGADGMFGIATGTDAATQVTAKVRITNDQFVMEPSSIRYLMGGHVQASPLVGKFVAFGSLPIQFDLHATLFFGLAGLSGGPTIDAAQGAFSIAPGVGGGFRLFISRAIAINVDLADVYMKRTLALTRFGKAPDPAFSGNMLFSAGVSVFLPPKLKRAD